MKSICIKTNNSNLLDYLLNELNYLEIEPVYICSNEFKHYKNIIVHYRGTNNTQFVHEISCILSCLIIDELEDSLLKSIIQKNYFYFSNNEINHILNMCYEIFSDDFNIKFDEKYNCLINCFENYLTYNKSIVLYGFINFRLKNYFNILENIVDEAVNAFIVEKEYLEFVSLLKLYINSQPSTCNTVHLIYDNENSVLLDEFKNVINISDDIFKAKYLSDITFSSNDYTLNGLLTLLPKNIYIHLTDNCIDDFINTLALIFENRVHFCMRQ